MGTKIKNLRINGHLSYAPVQNKLNLINIRVPVFNAAARITYGLTDSFR
jgi:hypothetical protein